MPSSVEQFEGPSDVRSRGNRSTSIARGFARIEFEAKAFRRDADDHRSKSIIPGLAFRVDASRGISARGSARPR